MQRSRSAGKKRITRQTPLKDVLEIAAACTRCGHCCRHGSGFLAGDDIKKIAAFLQKDADTAQKEYMDEVEQFNTILLRPKLRRYPFGECIFLDGNSCSIHEVKPLQCSTGNLGEHSSELRVWFALNYQVNKDDPESIRRWASYLRSGGKNIPGGELESLVPDVELLRKILR